RSGPAAPAARPPMEEDDGWGIACRALILVRAGSAVDRDTTDNSGHQRSVDVRRDHRLLDPQPPDLERRRGVSGVRVSPLAAASPPGSCPRGSGSPRTGLSSVAVTRAPSPGSSPDGPPP